MRIRSLAAAFAIALPLLALSASRAVADAPTDVVIHISPDSFGSLGCRPFACGVWDLTTGGFVDHGPYRGLDGDTAPPNRSFFASGPLKESFSLMSADGTSSFTIHAEERILGTFPDLTQVGVWQIDSGTGTYADAGGHGDVSRTLNPIGRFPITLNMTGVITKLGG